MKTDTNDAMTQKPQSLEGIFSVGKNDLAYVRIPDQDLIINIPGHKNHTALNRDTVRVQLTKKDEGEIIEVIRRAKKGFAGILKKHDTHYVLETADRRDPEIIIPSSDVTPEMAGKKLFVTIASWNDAGPLGTVAKIMGDAGDNNVEMEALALEKGFDAMFPEAVEEEANELEKRGITAEDIAGRRDIRDITTFTIDPEDAKDFDDAISFIDNGDDTYHVGIHIADVSHYVTPGSALDDEAQERTTSVYLVDRTIPMLPEALSNNLCSLRADEDKLAYSAIFTISKHGEVLDEWFGRTVICSDKRFTYEEAQEVLDTGNGPFAKELLILNNLAKKYTEQRLSSGALQIESPEVKFRLDDKGTPIKIEKKHRIDTNKLIEEFMLLANKRVAKFMSAKTKQSVFVYRVHDKPDPEKMKNLWTYLKTLGYKVNYRDGVIPTNELNALLREIDESDIKDAIQTAIVRSMAKAVYTTTNIGHYGLGFQFYTHFTSPIRRYPDVLVHRLVENFIQGKTVSREDFEFYERMMKHSSAREKDAQEAEWNSIAYKQVEYMGAHIGEVYEGSITNITSFGMFVRERETLAEGLVRYRDIPGDHYIFDEKKFTARGKKTKKVFTVGSSVKIKVLKADLKNTSIDYLIVS
jgi:ribonuclease R